MKPPQLEPLSLEETQPATPIMNVSLADMEHEARQDLDTGIKHIVAFHDKVRRIQASGKWREKLDAQGRLYTRWDAYFSSTFGDLLGYGYKRLQQIRTALPVIDYVETETGVTLNERNVRYLQSEGVNNPQLAARVVQRALEVAQDTGSVKVEPKHIKAVVETRKQLSTTGSVDMSGVSITARDDSDVEHVAAVVDSIEAVKRELEHRNAKKKRAIIRLKPDGTWSRVNGDEIDYEVETQVYWKVA